MAFAITTWATYPRWSWGRYRSTLVLLIALCANGCASVRDVPPGISPEGMNLISVKRMSVLTYVETDMYLPEGSKGRYYRGLTGFQRSHCPDVGLRITVLTLEGAGDARQYCSAIEGALRQVMSVYATRPIGIRLYLLPSGIGFREQDASLRMTSPRLSLVAPVFSDHRRTLGNIVDLVSHESFHLMGYLSGDERAADERSAYWIGMCSQLNVLGVVRPDTMPGGVIETENDAMAESSAGALIVRREILRYLSGGEIRSESSGGTAMRQDCRILFSRLNREKSLSKRL